MNRRHLLALALAGALPAALPVHAQPTKTIRLVVAFPPGGPVDLVARTIAEPLGKELDARVIVENKAGANGAIAAETVARGAADGTMLWLTSVGAAAVNGGLYEKLSYDMQRDFKPVSLVVNNFELLVVNPAEPASTAAEFIAKARKQSEPTTFASSGIGSIPHLAMEQLADVTGASLLHVPYKGAAPAITDVMGGQVKAFFGDVPGLIAHVRSGKLKPLGIAAPERSKVLPDVPTLAEQGMKGVDSNNWYALFAPAGTPVEVVEALNRAVRKTVASPGVQEKLAASGAEPVTSSPTELAELLKRDSEKWAALIRAKNIKPE